MNTTTVTKEQITEIMYLYGKGNNGRSIAEKMGLPHSVVHKTISTNSLHITSKRAASAEYKKSIGKGAKTVKKGEVKHTYHPFVVPKGAPICNATVTSSEPYLCPELSYRQPSRV